MDGNKQGLKTQKLPQVSRFDRGPRDLPAGRQVFSVGSRGPVVVKKSFFGFRRGSR